jgi:sugar phosphate isomerase/epimerase
VSERAGAAASGLRSAATREDVAQGAARASEPGSPVSERAGGSVSDRFAFNHATARYWALDEAVKACAAAGTAGIGLWRDEVNSFGLAAAARLVRDAGLPVTSLCRGGFFGDAHWYDENRRAIDEAATLGAPVLVLVSGGLRDGDRDLDLARGHVGEAVGTLVPHAIAAGVRLAIEPLHPMYCSDRCVVSTLRQALDLACPYPAEAVGVVVDTYHVWWDDDVWTQISRAGQEGRLACFQVADWITPLPEGVLLGRALPGRGCVQLRRLREAVDAAGYTGAIEIEVFHGGLWARPGAEVLAAAMASYQEHVA